MTIIILVHAFLFGASETFSHGCQFIIQTPFSTYKLPLTFTNMSSYNKIKILLF